PIGDSFTAEIHSLLIVEIDPFAFGKIQPFYALAFFQHRRYEQFLSEYKLIFHLNRLLVVRILHKQSAQNRKTGIISLSAVGIQIWEKLILQFDGRFRIFFGYFTKEPRLYRIVTFVMCTAQRIKDSELHPAGI